MESVFRVWGSGGEIWILFVTGFHRAVNKLHRSFVGCLGSDVQAGKYRKGEGGSPYAQDSNFRKYIYIHTPKLFTCMYVCMYVCMIIFYKPFSLHETPIS